MVWLHSVRKVSTKLVASPFTETFIDGVHSVVYEPGITPIAYTGAQGSEGDEGEFGRGVHRISGMVFSFDGSAAETLMAIEAGIDLLIYYVAGGNEHRIRTLDDVIFIGDAEVIVPGEHTGLGELVGVPFRVQFPAGDKLSDHVSDVAE